MQTYLMLFTTRFGLWKFAKITATSLQSIFFDIISEFYLRAILMYSHAVCLLPPASQTQVPNLNCMKF
jgi:hypothetical protein